MLRVSLINLNLTTQDAIGTCIINQARFFQRRGDQVKIYLQHPPRDIPAEMVELTQVVSLDDVRNRRVDHFSTSDLYVYHYPSRYELMDSIMELERGAVIFYYHNVTPPALLGSDFERDVLQYSLDSVRQLAGYADVIVTDSSFNAEDLIRVHGCEADRVRVLPLAVPLDQFAPSPKNLELLQRYQLEGKRVILFVGRMAGNKRIERLVQALPLIKQQAPNAVLLLVGDDRGNPAIQENVARARQAAVQLGVAGEVIFTGPVDDLAPYYRLASVYASASLHEGFGVPLIEAMASGVPVVVSNATAHPWVVGHAGLLVEPENVEDLAQKIGRVLTDDALCGDLVARGLLRAREFSLERYENGWGQIVTEATAWLPDQPYPFLPSEAASESPVAEKPAPARRAARPGPHPDLEWLQSHTDVMLRGYAVRSKAPLVGKLIAWVRRNMTSHLREPYLDPMFERQVVFNHRLVQVLQQQTEITARQLEKSEAERKKLAKQLEQITVAVGKIMEGLASAADPSAVLSEIELKQLALVSGSPKDLTPGQLQYHIGAESGVIDQSWQDLIWPRIKDFDFSVVVDVAAGFGRNSAKLLPHAGQLIITDINQTCIEACQQRFQRHSNVRFIKNDGKSLKEIESASVTLVYCFDAMVHFDSDVVRAYLREFQRILRPGGRCFLHHSNSPAQPGGGLVPPHSRNFMSKELFAHYSLKAGLQVIEQQVIDWGGAKALDCLTTLRKP